MSLARWALRTAAVEALKGQTLVGANVLDSEFTALSIHPDGSIITDQKKPFIMVYTDDGKAGDRENKPRDIWQNGVIDVVLEFGIATPMMEVNEETGESFITGIELPVTDAAMELTLDLIDRQITAALTGTSAWADIWKDVSDHVVEIERRRVARAENGVRIAGRQTRIAVMAKPDPVPGTAGAGSTWHRFRDAIDANLPALSAIATQFIDDPTADLSVDQIIASRGMTTAAAEHLGMLPYHSTEPDSVISDPQTEQDMTVVGQNGSE